MFVSDKYPNVKLIKLVECGLKHKIGLTIFKPLKKGIKTASGHNYLR